MHRNRNTSKRCPHLAAKIPPSEHRSEWSGLSETHSTEVFTASTATLLRHWILAHCVGSTSLMLLNCQHGQRRRMQRAATQSARNFFQTSSELAFRVSVSVFVSSCSFHLWLFSLRGRRLGRPAQCTVNAIVSLKNVQASILGRSFLEKLMAVLALGMTTS